MKTVSTLLSAALLLNACATTTPVEVPANLKTATSETLAMIVPARGVQIYECRARKDKNGHEWVFMAPEAELYDTKGNLIGRHGAGPHWEAIDGSRVTGVVKSRADAPEAGNIPWLLLAAKQDGRAGVFGKVTSIQRVNTAGGIAPSSPCVGTNRGEIARIDYRADYYFFSAATSVSQAFDGPARWSAL